MRLVLFAIFLLFAGSITAPIAAMGQINDQQKYLQATTALRHRHRPITGLRPPNLQLWFLRRRPPIFYALPLENMH
jgi:hypothetical protein